MRDAIEMWKEPRMVVLTGVCAAVYAAAMVPFKALVVFPGLAEVRPAAALPIVFSFLFGPAGAFGAAFGNLGGDMMGGMLGPGSIFGALANFAYGYLPYKLWRAFGGGDIGTALTGWRDRLPGWAKRPRVAAAALAVVFFAAGAALFGLDRSGALHLGGLINYRWGSQTVPAGPVSTVVVLALVATVAFGSVVYLIYAPIRYVLAVAGACLACAGILAWGIDLLGFVPFSVFGPWILVQNFVLGLTLGPPLLLLVYPRVAKRYMRFEDIMPETQRPVSAGWAWFTVAAMAALVGLGIGIGTDWLGQVTGLSDTLSLGKGLSLVHPSLMVKSAALGVVVVIAGVGIWKL